MWGATGPAFTPLVSLPHDTFWAVPGLRGDANPLPKPLFPPAGFKSLQFRTGLFIKATKGCTQVWRGREGGRRQQKLGPAPGVNEAPRAGSGEAQIKRVHGGGGFTPRRCSASVCSGTPGTRALRGTRRPSSPSAAPLWGQRGGVRWGDPPFDPITPLPPKMLTLGILNFL